MVPYYVKCGVLEVIAGWCTQDVTDFEFLSIGLKIFKLGLYVR
jgi:hypothetical protein